MRVLFDLDFDAGGWPGPRGDRAAVAGEVWLGPQGFLGLLETRLGLGAPHASDADRAAALVPRLFREDRFFGASARADPWATAQRLLKWRDHLWEHGWRGESAGERRLGELAEVTLGLPVGRTERLETVTGWLGSRGAGIDEVGLPAGRASLSAGWRGALAALEERGTRVVERPLGEAPASGNLRAVRAPGARLAQGDTTLQLVRPHGPRAGARALAAALAAEGEPSETVIIGADGVLDEAFAEAGLPTGGAPSAHDTGALAELLPLTLQLAWAPVDPQLALDWLTLPDLPLPAGVAARLAATLDAWPAVGNPEWLRVEDAMAASDRSAEVTLATLRVVFSPVAQRSGQVHVRDLLPRLELLDAWASERAGASAAHAQVLGQVRALRARFQRAELHRLAPPRLDAVLASVAAEASTPRQPALAGFHGVGAPGAVAGPARRVIWWGFTSVGSARRASVTLRGTELRALASLGAALPTTGVEMRDAAARARRPLHQAREALILVAPRHDEAGEPAHPHALWDEIASHVSDARAVRHLVTETPRLSKPPARITVPVTVGSPPERAVRVALPLMPRTVESPTSLEKLLGCSFAYALEYAGRLRRRGARTLAADSRLLGKIAHDVLAEVARRGALAGEAPSAVASQVLGERLPSLAALLLLPVHQQDLLALREAIGRSATSLGRVVQADGLRVHSVETKLEARLAARTLGGTPDLVLEDPAGGLVLLDLKWAGEGYRRDQLRSGGALQLAAYAAMLREGGARVRTVGYLIVQSGRLLVRGEPLSFAQRVRPELLDETWAAAERAFREREEELARGELFAEGVSAPGHTPAEDAHVRDGRLVVPPACGFCALDLLCGRGRSTL